MCVCVHTHIKTHLKKQTYFPRIPAQSLKACYSTSAQQRGLLQKSRLPSNPRLYLEALKHLTQGLALEGEMPELPCPALPRPEGCQCWEK